jgi:DNA-binding MarR family transcriptional regulator
MDPALAAREIAARCLAMRSRRLARTVSRLYDEALRPLGLGIAQLGLLVAIQRLAPASPAAVARRLDLEKSTLSRNLRRLREARLISETVEPAGKRLTLTSAGERVLAEAYPLWREAQRSAMSALGKTLAHALTRQDS